MGPSTLFDKSFLQALNRDEAAIFDVLFRANIAPLFFAETLADLEGGMRGGQSQEAIVGNLAAKTPVWGSSPLPPHLDLALMDLLGQHVAMDRRPVLRGGRHVVANGKKAVVFDHPPEMEAFQRWQRHDFESIERDFAKDWRESLRQMPRSVGAIIGIDGQKIKLRDLPSVKAFVDDLIAAKDRRWAILKGAMAALGLPESIQREVAQRWKKEGRPSLPKFAPYAAYVFSVDLFFHVAAATGKIAAERPSNRIDMAYLHYLPFSEILVSGDNLHERVAPLFLTERQRFVRAEDLKRGLVELDSYFSNHPDIEHEGLMRVAKWPPLAGEYFVSLLYDELRPGWRDRASAPPIPVLSPEANAKIIAELGSFRNPTMARPSRRPFEMDSADSIVIERSVPLKRGKWQFMPVSLKAETK